MTLNKRGLGRGLEALLVDVSSKEQAQPLSNDTEYQVMIMKTLVKSVQKDQAEVLKEAHALRDLLDELETMIRCF